MNDRRKICMCRYDNLKINGRNVSPCRHNLRINVVFSPSDMVTSDLMGVIFLLADIITVELMDVMLLSSDMITS